MHFIQVIERFAYVLETFNEGKVFQGKPESRSPHSEYGIKHKEPRGKIEETIQDIVQVKMDGCSLVYYVTYKYA